MLPLLHFHTVIVLNVCLIGALAYYNRHKCFATGDCIISAGYMAGGFNDPHQKWLIECNDGEAMIGIYDENHAFYAIAQIWCFFSFPLKIPSYGIYPYYPACNVRNFSLSEFYCYDKYYPYDTVDTFVTGKTPSMYRIDYLRCQWKYTHDKAGEHYDGYWIVKCDTHHVMTGIGRVKNPLDKEPWPNGGPTQVWHFVWIQCCPTVLVPDVRQVSSL